MLLWFLTVASFLLCVLVWYFKQGITTGEAIGIFVTSIIVFNLELNYIYKKNTTDFYLISGYATSVIHRPSYKYKSGKRTKTEPERWLIEQTHKKPSRDIKIKRKYNGKKNSLTEFCEGECLIKYPSGEPHSQTWFVGNPVRTSVALLSVSKDKFMRSKIGESSVAYTSYFNPVFLSDDIIYSDSTETIPQYFVNDYNKGNRFVSKFLYITDLTKKIELLNAHLSSRSNISVSLHIITDELYYEKLKRDWRNGKANDFAIVIHSPDGKQIKNVNVLAWNNYNLRQNMIHAIGGLNDLNADTLLDTIEKTLKEGPTFIPAEFEKLSFLKVKIPESDYAFILSYHAILMTYLILLLGLDPCTKTEKAKWNLIAKTWDRSPNPYPPWRYYIHPFSSTGVVFLYTTIPFLFFLFWQNIIFKIMF